MSRLPYLKRDELDEDGGAALGLDHREPGAGLVNDEGGLAGPFNAFVHTPPRSAPACRAGGDAAVRDLGRPALDRARHHHRRRLLESRVRVVGPRSHGAPARRARRVVEAIGSGEVPVLESDDDQAVYDLAHQLVRKGRLDDATYGAAQARLGDRGMVELVALCGYYTLVSTRSTPSRCRSRPGEEPTWPA